MSPTAPRSLAVPRPASSGARRRVDPPRLERLRRTWAVARLEALRVARDRTSLSLLVVVPALQIALFGFAVGPAPRDVPIAIARAEAEPEDRLRRAIAESGSFAVVGDGLPDGAAAAMVARGEARIGIELPRIDYFDEEALASPPRIVVDDSDPAAVRPALAALEIAVLRDVSRRSSPLAEAAVRVERLHNPEGRAAWAIAPGLAGVVMMISMLMLGALTLVRERERGTWEALLATPVDAVDALAGKLAPYVVLGSLQGAVVVAAAHLLFALPLRGDLAALALALPLYAAAHLVLGFAVSALAEGTMQALQGAVLFYLPSMLLSGFLFPFDAMPRWARALGEALPPTHFVRAARGVLLRGEGAALVAAEMAPVAAFTAVASLAALAAYRRRLE